MSDDAAKAQAIEARVRAALQATGITYEEVACDPALADTAAFCETYGFPPEQSANAIVVASKKEPFQYCCCVVLATDRLDVNKAVRKKMGVSKVSFAPQELAAELTGMLIGGVTPVDLPASIPVYVDAKVMHHPWVIIGGGSRSMKVKIDPQVFTKLANTEVVEGLSKGE